MSSRVPTIRYQTREQDIDGSFLGGATIPVATFKLTGDLLPASGSATVTITAGEASEEVVLGINPAGKVTGSRVLTDLTILAALPKISNVEWVADRGAVYRCEADDFSVQVVLAA